MHTLLRAGAVALAAGATLLGGAVAAQAADDVTVTDGVAVTAGVTVTAGTLVFEPAEHGHTGHLSIKIHNGTDQPYDDGFTITESLAVTFQGAGRPCAFNYTPDHRRIAGCALLEPLEPGATLEVVADFRSPAKPQPFARRAVQAGTVEAGGAATEFSTLFRSTGGSIDDPRPYTPDTVGALDVTAGDVTLTRQADGSFEGRVPFTVHNDGDAPHDYVLADIALPGTVDEWPSLEPSWMCFSGTGLPVPPGGHGIQCLLEEGPLAEDQTYRGAWVLRAPAGTPAGVLGTGATRALVRDPAEEQTDHANEATFTITVAG